MKLNTFIFLGLLVIASAAEANISIKLPYSANGDACANLPGVWSGGGKVKAGGIIECHYSGKAKITHVNSGSYDMDVTLHKDSGICPDNEEVKLPGSCSNGVLTLDTSSAKLKGNLNDAGTVVDLNGTVTFSIAGLPVVADVDDMRLQKE